MVRAKREYEGSLFAWLASAVIAYMPWTGRSLDPNTINPYGGDTISADLKRQMEENRKWIAWSQLAARRGTLCLGAEDV